MGLPTYEQMDAVQNSLQLISIQLTVLDIIAIAIWMFLIVVNCLRR